jgi:large subunit ribosomal protein L17
MNHKAKGRKFNRNTKQRKALLKSLSQALLTHGHIHTTLPKAKDLRPIVEKIVTLGKKCLAADELLHIKRNLLAYLGSIDLVNKLLTIAERFATRNGGYLRIIKTGFRKGDCAPMAIIEFV